MKKDIIYKKLSFIIIAILLIFSFINVALTKDQTTGKSENKTEKSQCCSSKETTCCKSGSSKVVVVADLNVSNWFNQAFLNLVDNNNYNLNLSNEALVFFLDKETIRDYVQIRSFKSWLTKKGYNNVQFVVFVNGKENEKTQLVNLVKQNKLDIALWPTSNLVSSLGVKEYPTVYYIVNGVMVDSTNRLDAGHLKKLIGWCEPCKVTKVGWCENCKLTKAKDNRSMNEKNCNCGSNCNCGCKEGKKCKCGH